MLVIPAIDIKDGRCVRLYQGDMARSTVYFDRPLAAARHWQREGARLIHIVDLDGAVQGRPVHLREVEAICKETGLVVQLGGGLRSAETVETVLAIGVARAVIGTAAYDDPDLLRRLCASFPDRIIAGIDARDGKAAVQGWTETTGADAVALARRCESAGVARIIYTDIERDGTRAGVNVEATGRLARSVRIPVIASGGVGSLEDLRRLKTLEQEGVEGVIVGSALYTGAFSLHQAIEAAGRII
ncbi:MAG TPA: 1-(5-phosphoribosyl)-5-[(5-phosphoribosylamino)methylideneamino]imidazole-4-carboxamide isomerase [Candidatus Eisenbacteria bacterium]|nr:1-(5-phosphoribosyl)-5-[(5-phosphoribosylamino)methylideneamino]imidazole-4-carboxamide isomerase [Candidatus Eisenbacteria bacterium]